MTLSVWTVSIIKCFSDSPSRSRWTGWPEWAGVGYFPSPGQLGSGNPPAGEPLVTTSSVLKLCSEEQRVLVAFKSVPFPPSAGSTRGLFSAVYHGNLVKVLEVSHKILWGSSSWLGPLEFLTLRFVHTEPAVIPQLQLGFSGTVVVSSHYIIVYFHQNFTKVVSFISNLRTVSLRHLHELIFPIHLLNFRGKNELFLYS